MKVAAVQMNTKLADVPANLDRARKWVARAADTGAQLVLLPEFFNSGMAFDEKMLDAALWGERTKEWLLTFSRQYGVTVGGSFLALNGGNAYNTFALAFPGGELFTHNKDIPTQFENCYYTEGDEENVLHTPAGEIGVALCWEMIRTDTVKRLAGRVSFMLAGSCWWDLPEDAPPDRDSLRAYNRKLALESPVTLAKMLGVPVIHAGHCARFTANRFPAGERIETRQMVGGAQITARNGSIVSRRVFEEGEGLATGDIEAAPFHSGEIKIPEGYWIPDLPQPYLNAWEKQNPQGKEYYTEIARPYYRKHGADANLK